VQDEEQRTPDAPENAGRDDDAPCEATLYQRDQDRGYSMRRAIYVGLSTTFALVVPTVLVFMHYDGPLATQLVNGLINLASTICMLYLGAGVIDRSQILHRIGEGFSRRRDGDGDGDADVKK
jgi:hypothetical protein